MQVIPNPVVTIGPPDVNRIAVIDSNELKHNDSRMGVFSVLPRDFRDLRMGGGVNWLPAHVTLEFRTVMNRRLVSYCASCVPPARETRRFFPLCVGWPGGTDIGGAGSSGTLELWLSVTYMCVIMIVSA